MNPRRSLCVLLAALLLPCTLAANPALAAGESLTFRVGWGLFMRAGDIKITAQAAPPDDGHLRLAVVTTTSTRGFAKAVYPFSARAESLFDVHTGRLLSIRETSKTQDRETKTVMTFDYAKSVANYVNEVASKQATLPVPPGDPMDLIMSLVETRQWNLKPGEKRDALVIFGDEFYELTLYAERYEEVTTSLGTFNTVMIVPRMEKTPPKGMFKRGSTVRVWVSRDDRHLPVKFQVEFKFGAGVATLVNYQPPSSAKAAASEPSTATAPASSSSAPAPATDAKNSRP